MSRIIYKVIEIRQTENGGIQEITRFAGFPVADLAIARAKKIAAESAANSEQPMLKVVARNVSDEGKEIGASVNVCYVS